MYVYLIPIQKYEEWKDNLPDFSWMSDYLPPREKIDEYRGTLIELKNRINFPEKGWFKQNMSTLATRIENLGEFLDNASDGDPTTIMAEGMNHFDQLE